MNIFYLHHVPQVAAIYHCDKHVVKMIIETAQLLSTAHHEHGSHATYKPTHKNHPSAVWARESKLQYDYLVTLGIELCQEYTKRYHKTHSTQHLFYDELKEAPALLKVMPWTWRTPPQCMPDMYKQDDTIKAYRAYYRSKANIMTMKWHQDKAYAPDWMHHA